MSATSGTQISKPLHEQVFEDNCVILWKAILKDPSVQKVGRRGQKQSGVDLFGYRDGNLDHLVGLQCKLKTGNRKLTEKEVRNEYTEALKFEPRPREYFILTTADDDQALQALARKLTAEQAKNGVHMACYVWGWGTICDEASQHPQALNAFDPGYSPHSKLILQKLDVYSESFMRVEGAIERVDIKLDTKLDRILAAVTALPGGPTSSYDPVEAHLDREIDGYRELANNGSARNAMTLFEQLLAKVEPTASGRIIFRIKANIGSCLIKLGRTDEASDKLFEAFDHAPDEPKAISNKALGLLLKKDWHAVLEMGKQHLSAGSADEHLSATVIQAAKFLDEMNDPLSLIPDQHRETAPVTVAFVDFLRARDTGETWRTAAKVAALKFPDEQYLRQFYADALLDEATVSASFQSTGVLDKAQRENVVEATTILRGIWEKDVGSDAPIDEEAIGVLSNLLVALRLLAETTEAILRIKQGLDSGTTSSDFYIRAAVIAMETRSPELKIDQLLEEVEDCPEKAMLQAQLTLARGDWKTLAAYTETDLHALPLTEQLAFETAVKVARISIGPVDDVAAELQSLLAAGAEDIRSLVVVADFAASRGHDDLAAEAFNKARELVTANTHFSGRYMLAKHALARELWSDAADLLVGRVDINVDNDPLQDLVTALVNERPPRQRALTFFRSLPPTVRGLGRYLHAEGFLHYFRGDLRAAEACLRRALPEQRADDFLLLLKILREQEKISEAEDALQSTRIDEIKGDPSYRMVLLQEFFDVGRGEEALATGYRLARKYRDTPEVVLKYIGLMLRAFDNDQITVPTEVVTDTSFRIESDEGKSLWFTIEGDRDRVSEGIISVSNPFAANAMGHPVGFEFSLAHGFDKVHQWAVKEIKHKYLFLFHDIMENFEAQFPGVHGISTFKLEEGNIEPVLSQVKKAAEHSKKIAEFYTQQRGPIAVVAASTHRDPISLSEYIRSLGHDLTACIGHHVERVEGLRAIEQHHAAGAVLDTYTAWTVAQFGLFGVLTAVFGQVVIPRSVLHDLDEFLGEDEYTERQSMSLSFHNGEFFKHIDTREEFDARRDYISRYIEMIKEHCQIVTVDAPDAIHPSAANVVAMFGPEPFNAAAVAGTGYVLVSDDHHYRQWAELLWSAKGTWLQAVLDFAAQNGKISLSEYADWIGQLAERRHGFVYLNGVTINAMIGDGTSTNWPRVAAALDYIGNKDADLQSHLETVVNFIEIGSRAGNASKLHFQKALGMLLGNMVRGRTENWHELLWYIYAVTKPPIQQYLLQWIHGHFLDPVPMLALHRNHLRRTLRDAVIKMFGLVSARSMVRIPRK
jgi:tetratricopeptide (TPR) repeat protein